MKREQLTREATKRPKGWTPPNSMSEKIDLGPDWVCRWIRVFIHGAEEDPTNFFRRAERGWVLVKPEEVPHLAHLKDDKGRIQKAGCVLCKNDAAMMAADAEYYVRQAIAGKEGAASGFLSDQDERMPKFSESKSKVFRGQLPTGA